MNDPFFFCYFIYNDYNLLYTTCYIQPAQIKKDWNACKMLHSYKELN